jgi:cytoskeletal protein CcmA (bactofilin family)
MAHSTLGRTLTLDGTVTGQGSLSVLGELRGKVDLRGDVSVPQGARANAEIHADNVEVGGEVTGNLEARDRVEVFSQGTVVGDIKAPRILIANGAHFKGNVAF